MQKQRHHLWTLDDATMANTAKANAASYHDNDFSGWKEGWGLILSGPMAKHSFTNKDNVV